MKGHICYITGIDNTNQGKIYTIVVNKIVKTGSGTKFEPSVSKVNENNLKDLLAKKMLKLVNAELDSNGELHGTTGSLDRFIPKVDIGVYPIVIMAEIRSNDKYDRLLGYTVARKDGTVGTLKAATVLGECIRIHLEAKKKGSDLVPIQNYIFVNDSDSKKAAIKSYDKDKTIILRRNMNKISNVQPAKVNTVENKKKLSRLEEIFTKPQIKQLQLGKKSGVDIKVYANPALSAEQMEVLRRALEENLNPRPYAHPDFSADAMKAYRIQQKYKTDIRAFINPKYNKYQILELSVGWLNGVDISKYADPKLSAEDMAKVRIEQEGNLWKESEVKQLSKIG